MSTGTPQASGPDRSARERTAFILFATGFGAYLVYRAISVPFIQDEANSFWMFVRTGEFLPFHSHPEAGNHFLNSALGWIFHALFGPQPWALRLGSLFAYVLYAFAVWGLTRQLRDPFVRWCLVGALIACPFLYEYFALFRGYGLSMAFFACGLLHLLVFTERLRARNAEMAFAALTLGVFSNLSLLPAAALIMVWPLGLCLLHRHQADHRLLKRVAAATTVFALVLAYAGVVAKGLQEGGAFYIGSNSGFMATTLPSLVTALFDAQPGFVPEMLLAAMILATCVAAWWMGRERAVDRAFLVVCYLFWGECVLRILLQHVAGVHYPEDRAGLQFIFPFLLMIAFATDRLARVGSGWYRLAGLMLVLPLFTLVNLNGSRAMNDLQQGIPDRFIEHAIRMQEELGRPLVIGGGGSLPHAWHFSCYRRAAMLQSMEHERFEHDGHDLRLVPDYLLERARFGFHIVDSTERGSLFLLKRDHPLGLELVLDSLLPDVIDPPDFKGLVELRERFRGPTVYVRVTGALSTTTPEKELLMVAEERAGSERVWADEVSLSKLRPDWNGETFDIMRKLPAGEHVTERFLYLWNAGKSRLRITAPRLRVYVQTR